MLKKLLFLQVSSRDDPVSRLHGRVLGTIWFPRSMLPSNNKLFLQMSPEVMLRENNLRVYEPANREDENHKGVRAQFRKWLQDCAAKFDMNLEFSSRMGVDEARHVMWYETLRIGHAEYRKGDKVKLSKGLC